MPHRSAGRHRHPHKLTNFWGQALALGAALLTWGAGCSSQGGAEISNDAANSKDALMAAAPITPMTANTLCLQPDGGKLANGTRIKLLACDQSNTQQWRIDPTSGNIRVQGNYCLDVTDGVNRVGTELQVWQCFKGNTNQMFDVNGSSIMWRNSDKCLDVPNGVVAGSQIKLGQCNSLTAGGFNTQAEVADESADVGGSGKTDGAASPGNMGDTGTGAVSSGTPDFGPNVMIFDSSMSMNSIQAKVSAVYDRQRPNHFGPERVAIYFKPGNYNLDVKVGFFTTVSGLGMSPDDVTITGSVRAKGEFLPDNNATQNFWRGIENLSVVPTKDNNAQVWAISQGTFFRRMHVKGNLNLSDNGWSSGGFIGDTKVDGTIDSGTQQQFLTRNSTMGRWQGANWNMVFVGDKNAPANGWPNPPYTNVAATPVIREKPYLVVGSDGSYAVKLPQLKRGSIGTSWSDGGAADITLPISKFYIAKSSSDSADSINAALGKGLHVLLTPGHYNLNKSLMVTYPNTVLLGMGIATLRATAGNAVITVADVPGVTVSGIVVDAGGSNSPALMVVGEAGANKDNSANPTVLHDMMCRVGGAGAAKASACITVNSRDVILDNTWLWRADHGDGAGWNSNPSANGLIVNGANVTAYGLLNEHFQQYQTLWNGENGATYMYQSEFPYDPPYQSAWQHDGVNGYASYKVANNVTKHTGLGMGMYSVFTHPVKVENAIESPNGTSVKFNHLITVCLVGGNGGEVTHIINGFGDAARNGVMTVKTPW